MTISINRPQAMNALNAETEDELREAVRHINQDENIGALILTGAGEKAFVGGADIAALRALENAMDGIKMAQSGQSLMASLEHLGKPVIAAINGFALGGGMELALACDIRLAADTARLGLTEINLGIIPGAGGTQRLPRLVGKGMSKYLILTGKHISAQEALDIGIVEKIYPAGELMVEANKLAADLAAKAPLALKLAKNVINAGLEVDLTSGCEMEAHCFGLAAATADAKEGTGAFLEKRPARFKGN